MRQPVFEQKVTELFELFRDSVYHYVVGILCNSAEAEQVTQESFLQFYQSLLKGVRVDNRLAWIFRVAHNLAIDQQRKRGRYEAMSPSVWDDACERNPDPNLNPEQGLLHHEKEQRLHSAVARLTPQEQPCLNLADTEGLADRR